MAYGSKRNGPSAHASISHQPCSHLAISCDAVLYTPAIAREVQMRRISPAWVVVLAMAATLTAQAPPQLQVNPFWPQPLPNHWVFGSITGVAVDAQDHVWVVHRGADSLEGNEKGMMLTPPTSAKCCTAAPFVLEF